MRGVQRSDQRLYYAQCAVKGARIAPGFEEMRFRNMPLAIGGGFVEVRTDVDGVVYFAELGGKIKIVRRGIDGIYAQNYQRVHFPSVHVRAQIGNGLQVI